MRQRIYRMGLLTILAGGAAVAQQAQLYFQQPTGPGQPAGRGQVQLRQFLNQFSSSMRLNGGGQGRWWSNPQTVEYLGLTADQVKKMDDIFQQHRIQLIDLNATVEKEEAILDPLVQADQPDDAKVLAQIDRVAQSRADLEKANSRMLWSVRRVLTQEQWKKLQASPKARRL
ncbi:MAG TPA: Spy/CpxP family protein refolding chaperone [Bryobacteraceae bacterium]|nr:Spy/CpxP family protein refolding chaperone [Bryobacteraceae bacterium]